MSENARQREKLSSKKCALLVFYNNDEYRRLLDWKSDQNKSYSDVFFMYDIKQISMSIAPAGESASVAFISTEKSKINYITRYRKDRIVATNKVRVFFDIILKLNKPLSLDFILSNAESSMKNSLSNIFFDDHIKIVNGNQWNEIVKSLIKLDSNNEKLLDRIFLKNSKYNKKQ